MFHPCLPVAAHTRALSALGKMAGDDDDAPAVKFDDPRWQLPPNPNEVLAKKLKDQWAWFNTMVTGIDQSTKLRETVSSSRMGVQSIVSRNWHGRNFGHARKVCNGTPRQLPARRDYVNRL